MANPDPLDEFIVASARTLRFPLETDWLPAVKTNLEVTLRHATLVAEFEMPDDAEPAPSLSA